MNVQSHARNERHLSRSLANVWLLALATALLAMPAWADDAKKPAATGYRNVALNPKDVRGDAKTYPHATSNSECRDLDQFAALNAINGQTENAGHGLKFPSWGPEKETDLWWKVEFGRPVEVDKLGLFIRADFPHDAYWHKAVIEFSDGTREAIEINKTAKRQTFAFKKRTVTWLKLTEFVQTEPIGWAALTEVEVMGRDVARRKGNRQFPKPQ